MSANVQVSKVSKKRQTEIEINAAAAPKDASEASPEATTEAKRTRTLIPFDASKAIARFSDDTIAAVLALVNKNAKEEQSATTTVEIAEVFFGHEKYKGIVSYMVLSQLGEQCEITHGPTGGVVPKGFTPASNTGGSSRRVFVTEAFAEAVEAAIEQCLVIAKKGGKNGASLNWVTMRLVENDVLNGEEVASTSSVTAALHSKLAQKYTSKPNVGIVRLAFQNPLVATT